MKYGVHFRSWDGLYSADRLPEFLRQAKEIGADTFELFPPEYVIHCDKPKIRQLKAQITDIGLDLLLTCRYPANMDLASSEPGERQAGIAYMKQLIEGAAELGCHEIGGIIYSVWPHNFSSDMIDKNIKYERTQRSIESLRAIMPTAESCDVYLNAEVLNRFEHYMLNTAEEGVHFCDQIESSHFGLLLDVFHMNIEEESLEKAILTAGKHIGHFHVSEPNRMSPQRSSSRINWASVGKALRDTAYCGSVTMEPIFLFLGQASYNSRMWRDLIEDTCSEARLSILKDSLDFIKGTF